MGEGEGEEGQRRGGEGGLDERRGGGDKGRGEGSLRERGRGEGGGRASRGVTGEAGRRGAGWSCIGRGGIGEEWRGGAQEPNIIQHSIAEISRLKQKSYSAAESGWRSLGHVLHCAQREGCVNHVTDFKMAHMRDESRRMQRQT